MKNKIQLFEEKKVRTAWVEESEEWYFSVVDVVGVLTDSPNPNNYWKVLKSRLKKEGSELVTNCNQLKMKSADGKYYKTDVVSTQQLFRLIIEHQAAGSRLSLTYYTFVTPILILS